MLYELKRGRVGLVTFEELNDDYIMYGFPKSTIEECNDNPYNFRSNIYTAPDLIFVILDIINLFDVFGDKNRAAIYIRSDLLLIVVVKDRDKSILKTFERVVKHFEEGKGLRESVPERFLYHFLDYLLMDDRRFLENMEINMSVMESRIMNEQNAPELINDILTIKKELICIWNYYDQLIDLGEILRDNETEMFPEAGVKGFAVLTKRTMRLSDNVKQLRDYVVQLQESYDAMLSYNLNNIMKLFTVITTIFLPLSLIVGWYGMNFEYMPELSWKYGYHGIIILSVVVIIGCVILFKRYKLI